MQTLKDFLKTQGYYSIKLKLIATNHFKFNVKINGVKGSFILDTGASGSCVGLDVYKRFNLKVKDSEVTAIGAGASDMATKISYTNKITTGKWTCKRVTLIIFDLSHVNLGLTQHNAMPVDGIIGADILKKGKAIIDYSKKYLYLKEII